MAAAPRVCFTTQMLGFAMQGADHNLGGAEMLYARLGPLVADDLEVTLVGAGPVEATESREIEGCSVRFHPYSPGLRPDRILATARHIWRGLKQADPDIVVQGGGGLTAAIAWRFCRRHGRRFVYHWQSDADLDGGLLPPWAVRPFLKVRRGADLQVCLTREQQDRIPDEPSRVIANFCDDRLPWPRAGGSTVLWVANIRPEAKRPDRVLQLADALPDRRFVMVGEMRAPPAYRERFEAEVAARANVEWVDGVAHDRLPEYYGQARCLLNTSDIEGFPITFLEAFASSVPVVSLRFDPNQVLQRTGAGACLHGDERRMASEIEACFDDRTWQKRRQGCQEAAEEHRPEAIAGRWTTLLHELWEGK